MIACQPVGANSLEVSIMRNADAAIELPRIESLAFSAAETIASDSALHAVRQSGGAAVSASETAIRDAVRDLGGEGIAVEPSSALPVACLSDLLARGLVDAGETLVCVLTAHAAAWADRLPVERQPPAMLENDPAAIEDFLARQGLA
jgi:threonine synthase